MCFYSYSTKKDTAHQNTQSIYMRAMIWEKGVEYISKQDVLVKHHTAQKTIFG